MLQLGLLRVITWPGSWFKKQRVKSQSLFVPTRSSWCSPVLCSVNCAFEFLLNLEWYFGDGSDKSSLLEKEVIFCNIFPLSRICSDLFFDLLSLIFSWLFLFCFETTVRQKLGITNQNQNSEVITKPSTTWKMLKKEKVMKMTTFSNKCSTYEPSPSIRAKIPHSIGIWTHN